MTLRDGMTLSLNEVRRHFEAVGVARQKTPERLEIVGEFQRTAAGKIKKFVKENTLLGQPFVKNPDQTVGQLLADQGAQVHALIRMEVGEGIEKRSENFVEEVMAQVQGA